jgi:hypothetical protein
VNITAERSAGLAGRYAVEREIGRGGDVSRRRIDGSGRPERVLRSQRSVSEQVWSPLGNALLARTSTSSPGAVDIIITSKSEAAVTFGKRCPHRAIGSPPEPSSAPR